MMKMKITRYLAVLAAAAALILSCKKDKDDETTTKKDMSGTFVVDYPAYVHGNEPITLIPRGLYTTDGTNIGYYWRLVGRTTNDTTKFKEDLDPANDGRWVVTLPDSLATFSIGCTAYADDYYTSSASINITVVDDEESITDRGFTADDLTFNDIRDGRVYHYTTIAGLDWMKENLAWNGAGKPFYSCDVMDGVVGRFYSREEAETACPDGWRLPSEAEWAELAKAVGPTGTYEPYSDFPEIAPKLMADAKFNGTTLWEYWPEVKIDNASSLAFIPSGYAVMSSSAAPSFSQFGDIAAFWSSDLDGEDGWYRYVNENKPVLYSGKATVKGFLLTVRCVR